MQTRNSGRTAALAAVLAAAMLAGCASGPSVRATTDPAADFGAYRTYGFLEHVGTDRGDYSTIVSRALKAAVNAEMEKRGYRLAEAPDLLINFQANTRKTQEVSSVPLPSPFYRGGYLYGYEGPWGYGCMQNARDVSEGTLNIDIVDRQRKQTVWEGVALGQMSESRLRQPEVSLPPLVAGIFSKFQYAAGRGVASPAQP